MIGSLIVVMFAPAWLMFGMMIVVAIRARRRSRQLDLMIEEKRKANRRLELQIAKLEKYASDGA